MLQTVIYITAPLHLPLHERKKNQYVNLINLKRRKMIDIETMGFRY